MERLWETDSFVDDNTLTVNVNRLRKKLGRCGSCRILSPPSSGWDILLLEKIGKGESGMAPFLKAYWKQCRKGLGIFLLFSLIFPRRLSAVWDSHGRQCCIRRFFAACWE